MNERQRRTAAQRHRDAIVPDSGVTFAGQTQTAYGPSITVGYLPAVSQTWGCQHMTISGALFAAPSAGCGCDMQPIP